jgi:hypothetical protein
MSVFVATSLAPQIDLRLLRRDYFDGVSLLLQDADGVPYDLANVQVCASIFKNTISGTGRASNFSTLKSKSHCVMAR